MRYRALRPMLILGLAATGCRTPDAPLPTVPTGPAFAKPPSSDVLLSVSVSDAGTRIRSDGLGNYVNGVNGVAAYLDGPGNLNFVTVPGPRTVVIDYSVQLTGVPYTPVAPVGGITIRTLLNGVNSPTPQPRLQDLSVGSHGCYPMSVGYGTPQPNPTRQVRILFHRDSENTPTTPTSFVRVSRTSATTWTVTSSGCGSNDDVGGVADLDLTVRKAPWVQRGYYSLPLSMTLTQQ
ncbi:MAG: hypothetical protein ACKVZ0_25375 [Gemmatimonadales bacterium]